MAETEFAVQAQAVRGSTIADLVSEPALLKLFDYWCGKRQGRPMPAKEDIDPIEIPWALNRIFLMDYSPDDGFRYRLAGEEISKVFGHGNLRGLRFADIMSEEGARTVEERWTTMVRDRSILSMTGMIYYAAERSAVGERLLMPLADDAAGPVTGTVGMTIYEWLPGETVAPGIQSRLTTLPVADIP